MLQLYCSISAFLSTWLKAALRVVVLLVLLVRSSIRGDFMCVRVCVCVSRGGGGKGALLNRCQLTHPGPGGSWLCVSSEISFTTHKTILIFY